MEHLYVIRTAYYTISSDRLLPGQRYREVANGIRVKQFEAIAIVAQRRLNASNLRRSWTIS